MHRKTLRVILYLLLLMVLLVGAAFSGLNWYLESNKTKLIQQLEALRGGVASFSAVKVQAWQHFPTVSITMDSVSLHDSLFTEHQIPLLELSQIRVDFSLSKILQDNIEIKRIHLHNGQINIFTDQDGYSNLKSFFPAINQESGTQVEEAEESFLLGDTKLELHVSKVNLRFIDELKNKHIEATANELLLNVNQSSRKIDAHLNVDLKVKELAFNTSKGGFLKDSRVKGQLKVQMEDGIVIIPMSPLCINDQDFLVGADIFTDKKTASRLYFNNSATNYNEAVKLLTPRIQEKMNSFHIAGLFPTETLIEGTFEPGKAPNITVNFELTDREVRVKDYFFENFSAEGRFSNWLFDDERLVTKGKNNVRVEFSKLAAQYGDFHLETPDLLLLSKPGNLLIKSNLKVKGEAPAISDWFKTKQFQFDKGRFELEAKIDGPLDDINELIISSDANLVLQDIDVLYKSGDVIFPLDRLVLKKVADEGYFKMGSSKFNPIHDLNLEGSLKKLPAILVDIADQRASSEVIIDAKKISWTEFLNYFGTSPSKEKTDTEKKQTLKKTISGVHQHFHPKISLVVDTLTYYDKLLLTNFFSYLYFEDEHTLVLKETILQYGEGLINLSGSMDISNPYHTPFSLNFTAEHLNLQKLLPSLNYFGIQMLANMDSLPADLNLSLQHQGVINDSIGLLEEFNSGKITFNDGQSGKIKGLILYEPVSEGLDTKITIEGKPELINEFYDSEDFFFSGGSLKVDFSYQGDIEYVDQLVQEAKVNLSIKDSEIYDKPIDVYFPIKELSVDASQGNANFDLTLQSDSLKRKLNLKGKFDNLDAFLLDNVNKAFQVNAEAFSPKFYWQDFESLLEPGRDSQDTNEDINAVRESIKALLRTFDPEFKLRFDTLVYSDKLILESVHTGLDLLDSNFLKLDKTGFTFHKGTVQLNAQFDLGGTNRLPFEAVLQTDHLDIASLMQNLDYLGIQSLQEAENLTGELSMQLDLVGIFDGDLQTLVPDATNAIVTFNLQNVTIEGFQAIEDFAKKINMKRRFADIRFAPLSNTITIRNSEMKIPLMEIQSNAIQLFIEGIFRLNGGNGNIWISLPLKNLKKPNLNKIPEKTGYALTGDKVYLEINIDSINESTIKFRLGKKKFYKDRGILKQFKLDKKQYRLLRKNAKGN